MLYEIRAFLGGRRLALVLLGILLAAALEYLRRHYYCLLEVLGPGAPLCWFEMTSTDSLDVAEGSADYKIYPQFMLFGDSITQSAHQTLIPALSERYLRRLDVVNRGFSGYTAPMALEVFTHFFPDRSPSSNIPHVRLMTIFFGANDACLPGSPQHVSLDEYKGALQQIANYEGLKLHGTKIIFIVPGPVDEHQMSDGQRTAQHTAMYAGACREVASNLDLPVLDLWTIFMKKVGWRSGDPADRLIGSLDAPRSKVLAELLIDGLHFSDKAYTLMYEELKALICHELPGEVADKVPVVFPDWKDVLDV